MRCPTYPPAVQTSSRASSSTPAPIISDVPLALLQHPGLVAAAYPPPPHGAPPPPPPLAVPPPPPPPAAPPPYPAYAIPGALAAALARLPVLRAEQATNKQLFNAAAPGSIQQRVALISATALAQESHALEATIAVSMQQIHPPG